MRFIRNMFCHRINTPATSLFSQRAVTLIELVISIVVFSIILLAIFCVILSNVQFLQIFRQEAALKEDNAHIVDRLKRIVMNSEHVEIKDQPPQLKIELKMYDRKNTLTGTVKLDKKGTLTYKNELDKTTETLSTNVGSLTFSDGQNSGNMSNIRLLKVALTTSDPRKRPAVASCSIITSIACRLSPRTSVVYNVKKRKYYDEIQPAIDDASSGDEIRCMGKVSIFDGVFPELITIDKTITLRGSYDAAFDIRTFDSQNPTLGTPATIDGLGQKTKPIISITGGDVTIEGFVIKNGGSGIRTDSLGTTIIRNNTITGNETLTGSGGGIYIKDADETTISNNSITENSSAFAFDGGGIYIAGTDKTTISNNSITGNSSSRYGGGIYIQDGVATISNNIITGNSTNYGGGICTRGSGEFTISNNTITENNSLFGSGIRTDSPGTTTITISNNTITGNGTIETGVIGGGINVVGDGSGADKTTISNNTITGNNARSGGGISVHDVGVATISNNAITGNNSSGYGGGIDMEENNTATISNNIITGNGLTRYGGGIYIKDAGAATISNNTITGNGSSVNGSGIRANGTEINIINSICYGNTSAQNISYSSSLGAITYSNIEVDPGKYSGDVYPDDENTNINVNPLFVGGDPYDYHLQNGSPCVDSGNPDSAYYYDPEDPLKPGFALYPPARGTIKNDMGAYGGPGAGVIGFVKPSVDLSGPPNIKEDVIGTY